MFRSTGDQTSAGNRCLLRRSGTPGQSTRRNRPPCVPALRNSGRHEEHDTCELEPRVPRSSGLLGIAVCRCTGGVGDSAYRYSGILDVGSLCRRVGVPVLRGTGGVYRSLGAKRRLRRDRSSAIKAVLRDDSEREEGDEGFWMAEASNASWRESRRARNPGIPGRFHQFRPPCPGVPDYWKCLHVGACQSSGTPAHRTRLTSRVLRYTGVCSARARDSLSPGIPELRTMRRCTKIGGCPELRWSGILAPVWRSIFG